jgi:hypothetical protein
MRPVRFHDGGHREILQMAGPGITSPRAKMVVFLFKMYTIKLPIFTHPDIAENGSNGEKP